MTEAEQFLTDLEAKAKAAKKNWGKKYSEESDEAINQLEATMIFIDIADPAAVLRLVGMVRWLAEQIREDDGGSKAWIQAAYHATEPHHD